MPYIRTMTDNITDWFFTTSEFANANLRRARVGEERIFFVGNAMIDNLLANLHWLHPSEFWTDLGLQAGAYGRADGGADHRHSGRAGGGRAVLGAGSLGDWLAQGIAGFRTRWLDGRDVDRLMKSPPWGRTGDGVRIKQILQNLQHGTTEVV